MLMKKRQKNLKKKCGQLSFTFDDFLDQLGQVSNMGPLDELLKMMPGANKIKGLKMLQVDEKQMGHVEAIIHSMTTAKKNHT